GGCQYPLVSAALAAAGLSAQSAGPRSPADRGRQRLADAQSALVPARDTPDHPHVRTRGKEACVNAKKPDEVRPALRNNRIGLLLCRAALGASGGRSCRWGRARSCRSRFAFDAFDGFLFLLLGLLDDQLDDLDLGQPVRAA